MTRTDAGIYVYGLVADGALAAVPDVVGIDGSHALEGVTEGEVCALVSRVSLEQFDEQTLREHLADMDWVEQTARRHQLVLDAVLEQCTPLPMRLFTLYSDEDGLRQMLDREQHELAAALRDLSGKLEWGVQVFASGRAAAEPPTATPAPEGAATSGTSYLRSKLAGRDAEERQHAELERVCEQLHADLCAIASSGRLGIPQRLEVSMRDAPMILNAFYLVPNEQREAFCARAAELHDEIGAQGIDLRLTGPWAPYNFITTAVGGGR